MKKLVFYRCQVCGNVVIKLVDKGVPVFCCGQMMSEIQPNTTDAAVEKHCPVVQVSGNIATVKVGEVAHPMTAEHFISHIVLLTNQKVQFCELQPGQEPQAAFALTQGEQIEKAFSFCNLHGVWAN